MGITGLIPFLEKSSRRCNVKEFSGQTAAIDAYCWLHKGAFACAEQLAMNEPTTMYVSYCMKFVNMLLSHNIKPILVFDGQNLPAKALTENKRRSNRDVNRRKGQELMRAGKVSEGRGYLRRSIDVTHEMALKVIKECRRRNVDCIVAPYEADAQLAYLSINDIANVIITEDSDLLLFGCKRVLFKMDVNGNGLLIEQDKLHLSMGVRSDLFSHDKFRLMCILSGCDYIESLPGIGLSKACKFVNRTSEPDIFIALQKLPGNLNMRLEVSDDYRYGVVLADQTFRCQLVFDPKTRRQIPLTEPRSTEKGVGDVKDDETAFHLALGNLHPRTLQKLDAFNPDLKQTFSRSDEAIRAPHQSIWSRNYVNKCEPKQLPTILRQMMTGKSVESNWKPPSKKRSMEEVDEEEKKELGVDLMALYSSKKPKMSVVQSENYLMESALKSSRYFSSTQDSKGGIFSSPRLTIKPTDSIFETSKVGEPSEVSQSDVEKVNESSEETSLTEGTTSPTIKPKGIIQESPCKGDDDPSDEEEKQNTLYKVENKTDHDCERTLECLENEKDSDSAIDSLPSSYCSINSNPEDADTGIFESSAKTPNRSLGLQSFKFKSFHSYSNSNEAKSFDGSNMPCNSPIDTVGTNKSVFFSGLRTPSRGVEKKIASSSKSSTGKPKLRTGLSKRSTPSQQSLLTKFGFQTRPKV